MQKQKMQKRLLGALAMLSAVLTWSVGALASPPPGIDGNVTIQNGASQPVPVVIQGADEPIQVLPPETPFWRGEPKVIFDVVLNASQSGFQRCEQSYAAEPGKALLLHTVSGAFNTHPSDEFGSMSIRVAVPPSDGGDPVLRPIRIPAGPTAPASQVAGLFDAYSGSLTLPGLPVVEIETCVIGVDSAVGMTFVGYEIDLPNGD